MPAAARGTVGPARVERFLRDQFDIERSPEPLRGGRWSAAYGFVSEGRRLVMRVGGDVADYRRDQLASTWAGAALPIPEFVALGALDAVPYAITTWAPGDPLDELGTAERWTAVLAALAAALEAIAAIEPPGEGCGTLGPDGVRFGSNRAYVLGWLLDPPDGRLGDWRASLEAVGAMAWYERGCARIDEVFDVRWDRRRLVHTDLGAGNVLVDGAGLGGVIDWGNAIAGDPAADVAHLTFWAPWHPGCPEVAVRRELTALLDGDDVDERVRAWELVEALAAVRFWAAVGEPRWIPYGVARAAELGSLSVGDPDVRQP